MNILDCSQTAFLEFLTQPLPIALPSVFPFSLKRRGCLAIQGLSLKQLKTLFIMLFDSLGIIKFQLKTIKLYYNENTKTASAKFAK